MMTTPVTNETAPQPCPEETALATEFSGLYSFLTANAYRCPKSNVEWESHLSLARNSRPILDATRARGLDLVILDQYTSPGTDRRPLFLSILEWLPRIQDPLTLTMSLARLLEPEARLLLKRHREMLLSLARQWNGRLGNKGILAQCIVRVMLDRDVPEVVEWARNRSLLAEERCSYAFALQRFARKPGPARDALLDLIQDAVVGGSVVRILAATMKTEALPVLHDLRRSSPDERIRSIASDAVRRIELRGRKLTLPRHKPNGLPLGYRSTSIELDTVVIPGLLAVSQEELGGSLPPGIADQLALSASQLRRGRGRFHIVNLSREDGALVPLGFGFFAEDDDVSVVEVHYPLELHARVNSAMQRAVDADRA